MHLSAPPFRFLVAAALAVAVLGTAGCSWFRKGNDLYAQSPENRPLEVPPDLDLPDTSGAMALPADAPRSVTRSATAPRPAAQDNNTGFNVQGDRDAVFNRIGEVLAATEGVTIASKAQILGTYDVDYAGSQFLLRVTRVGEGAYVSAVDPRGMPAAGDGPAKLVAALKAALGGS